MATEGLEERLLRELSAMPADVGVHVWYDPDRLKEEGVRFLVVSAARLAERIRTTPDVGPIAFDAPGAHVLVQRASASEPRVRAVRARHAEL